MLKNYLKIAIKVLFRRKFFTFISLFGISFTLVVLMVVAAFFDHLFGPLPPETRADRMAHLYWAAASKDGEVKQLTFPGYKLLDQYGRGMTNVEHFSIHSYPLSAISFKNGQQIRSYLKRTDGEFWEAFSFRFLEGNSYSAEDVKKGSFVAVINQATAEKFFGNESAVGKNLEIDGQRFRVAGVVPNVPIIRITTFADVWVPWTTSKTDQYRKESLGFCMGSILATRAEALPGIKEEFCSRLARVEWLKMELGNKENQLTSYPEALFDSISRIFVTNTQDSLQAHPQRLWIVVLVLMILFMLLPTVNLVNINISRIRERASEIGVRKAFGASSRTLVGQFVVENLLLTLVGGLLGFVFSIFLLRVLTSSGWIQYAEFHMNFRIFFASLGMALFFGLFSGVYPAWKMSRLHPVEALRGRLS
jgi:putative ABC transport system permease protein